ncbi:Permease of the drug/metabolite transporter (DMT) superfamily protein [Minicystis rosea]|nr:Permease of the drug/metabolite transporter (DMT) superfamily protein [Minicystis rosea]
MDTKPAATIIPAMSPPLAGAPATRGATIPPLVLLCLAAVYIVWSSTYLALRYAVESLPPLLSAGARYVVAGAILYAILRARGAAAPTARQWWNSIPTGGLMFLFGNGFVALAEQRVSSGLAAVACAAMPLFACIISHRFGDRPSPREWAGVVVGFVGIVLLTFGDLRAAPAMGALLLLAPAGWALGSVLARRLSLPSGTMSAATLMMGGGALTLLVAFARGERIPHVVPLSGALAILYLVLFGSILTFSAYTYLLQNTSTALATSYAYVNPVLAVLLGAVIGGERPGRGLIIPGAIVVAGVAVMATGRGRPVRPARETVVAEREA